MLLRALDQSVYELAMSLSLREWQEEERRAQRYREMLIREEEQRREARRALVLRPPGVLQDSGIQPSPLPANREEITKESTTPKHLGSKIDVNKMPPGCGIRGEVYNDAGQLLVISHKITSQPNNGVPKNAIATYEERDGIAAQACKCCWCGKEYEMGDLVHGAAKSKRQSKRFCPGPKGWKDCASAYFNAHYIANYRIRQQNAGKRPRDQVYERWLGRVVSSSANHFVAQLCKAAEKLDGGLEEVEEVCGAFFATKKAKQ